MKKILLFLAFCSLTSSGIAPSFAMDKNPKSKSNLENNLVLLENNQKATRDSFLISQSGGPGGNPFSITAGQGDQITSITIYSGNVVDAISVTYASSSQQKKGGIRGHQCPVRILSNEYIKTVKVKYGNVVDSITFGLAQKGSNRITNWTTCGGRGGFRTSTYTAPNGQAIVGFHGREGNVIDSIGVYYGSMPR